MVWCTDARSRIFRCSWSNISAKLKLNSKYFSLFIRGPRWVWIMKKTRGWKSHDTLPLSLVTAGLITCLSKFKWQLEVVNVLCIQFYVCVLWFMFYVFKFVFCDLCFMYSILCLCFTIYVLCYVKCLIEVLTIIGKLTISLLFPSSKM